MHQLRIIISSCSAPDLSLCRNVYCIFSREKIRKKRKEDMTTRLSTSTTISIYTPISSRTSRLSSSVLIPRRLCSSDLKLNPTRFSLRCNSSLGPGGPGPGENDSRSVLDAFFLGKALAEALNERIESTVGEFLSAIGRLQAEQQKQVQDFQEDVFERAKRAKEKAAREAMEAQGLVPKSSSANGTAVVDSDTTANVPSATDATTTAIYPSSSNSSGPDINTDPGPNDKDSLLGASNED